MRVLVLLSALVLVTGEPSVTSVSSGNQETSKHEALAYETSQKDTLTYKPEAVSGANIGKTEQDALWSVPGEGDYELSNNSDFDKLENLKTDVIPEGSGNYQASQYSFVTVPAGSSYFRDDVELVEVDDDSNSNEDDDDDDNDDNDGGNSRDDDDDDRYAELYRDDVDKDDDSDEDSHVGAERFIGYGYRSRSYQDDDDDDDDDQVRPFIGPQLPDIVPEPLPAPEPIPQPAALSLPLPQPNLEPLPQPLPQLQPRFIRRRLLQPLPQPEPVPVVVIAPEPLPLEDAPVDLPVYPPLAPLPSPPPPPPPPTPVLPILREPEPEPHSVPDYSYGYAIKDPFSGVDNTKQETRLGDRTEGSYSTLLPDGRRQVVTYWVDGYSGYNAEVTYEGVAHHPVVVAEKPAYAAGHDYLVPGSHLDNPAHRHDYLVPGSHLDNPAHHQGGNPSHCDGDLERVYDRTPIRGGYRYATDDNALCRCHYARPPRY